jgi:hypothetical protein
VKPLDVGILGMALASLFHFVMAWLIGVQGMLTLISNYRRKPEDFPDGAGLGRWMGWTLAAGGASFGLGALAGAGGLLSVYALAPWAGLTAASLAALALAGVAKFRRRAPPGPGGKR